jgi:choice-of-anchor A domain-containing protein
MTMKKPHAGQLARCTLAVPALIGCIQSADLAPSEPPLPPVQVEQTGKALNTGLPATDENQDPYKGHLQATKLALSALDRRNLLPPQMKGRENQYYIYYGTYFADNTAVGRPGTLSQPQVTNQAPHALTANRSVVSSNSAWISWPDSHDWVPVEIRINADGGITWVNEGTADKPTTYAQIQMHVQVQHRTSFILAPPQPWTNDAEKTLPFTLDNFYHYTFQDVYEMPGHSLAEPAQESTLRLYPLTLADLKTIGSVPDDDIGNKIVGHLVNQPLLAGAERGITKYGAILYQLARKFFTGACYEPSLSELILAGRNSSGLDVGTMTGIDFLSSFHLDFPHTVLGGMPYVCANGSDPKNACADGLPTWPIWVPAAEPTSLTDQTFLDQLTAARPGLSDHVALIYLGWAAHMIQDAATPYHAANWTGLEHQRQDDYGDTAAYWLPAVYTLCPDGTVTKGTCAGGKTITLSGVEAAAWKQTNDLLGTEENPKTPDQISQICSSVGVNEAQLFRGDLNYTSVQPIFLNTAAASFAMKKEATLNLDANALADYVQGYLANAYLSTIKLLLCAPPAQGESCPATPTVDEPLNQGTIAGTQQRYPWDFNVFTFGDAMGLQSVDGPVATEGALHMTSFSLNRFSLKPVALVAGGELKLASGTVYGVIHAGGGGTIDGTVNLVPPTYKIDNAIDFYTMYVRLAELSQALKEYGSTGTVTPSGSSVRFAGSLPRYNVFSVSGAALTNYRTFELAIPPGATAVINVLNDLPDETPVTFQNAGFTLNGTDPRRIMWNFNGVRKISIASIDFRGTALAPDAVVTTNSAVFDGTLIAKSLGVSTYSSFYWDPFGGDFPPVELTPPGPCTPAAVPTATATPGDGRVVLSWTASAGATSYFVESRTASQTEYTPIAHVTTGTTYTHMNLSNGTTYYYVVTADKGSCSSLPSDPVSATPTAPCTQVAPTGLTANPGSQQVTLTWTAAAGATSYEVSRSATSGTGYTLVGTVNAPTTTFLDSDGTLVNGVTYYYVVTAHNGICGSPDSAEVSAMPGCTPPAVPTGVTATANNNDGSITVAWGPVTGTTGYTVSRSTAANGTYSPVSTNQTNTTYTDSTGLTSGTTYYYEVSANNAGGTCASAGSSAASAVSCTLPPVPTGVTATANTSNGSITVAWGPVTGATGYSVSRSTTANGTYNPVSANQTSTTYTDSTGLASGASYYYKVSASNAGGICASASSSAASAVSCTLPAVPTGLNATVGAVTPGSGEVALTWTASTNASSYEVLRSTTSGSGYNSIATPTSNSYTDSGLTNNTTYYYVVRARNGGLGCSTGNSTQVSATPQGCQVLSASQNAFTLNTTNAVCFVTCWDLAAGSWNCSSFTQANRTLTINGQAVNCGGTVPAKVNSGYTISVGTGGHTWDQINWWDNGTTHAHACP